MIALYGIRNCDRMKKARAWLDARGIAYVFHDYKQAGLDEATLRVWIDELGWPALINRRGQMWRKLDPELRETLDEAGAVRVMLTTPAIIRRPILDTGERRHIGFDEADYEHIFES
ncbi:MAG TPA: ArsC family reductase [Chromatiaceae bacterium]|nr:MAG: ArsC family reductase [Thiohalocapsa sp. PB-PSB1]HBG96506.1 ArsC family reductase [Chromatiaceae bacterium]HCS90363.1 ArsC family reductase [Chromatiaceae bacterium]